MTRIYNDLIDIGASFDWMTPLWAEIRDIFRGPAAQLSIPAVTGWGRSEIRDYLKSRGIESWGYTFNGVDIIFSVKKEQTALVELLLSQRKDPPARGFWGWLWG